MRDLRDAQSAELARTARELIERESQAAAEAERERRAAAERAQRADEARRAADATAVRQAAEEAALAAQARQDVTEVIEVEPAVAVPSDVEPARPIGTDLTVGEKFAAERSDGPVSDHTAVAGKAVGPRRNRRAALVLVAVLLAAGGAGAGWRSLSTHDVTAAYAQWMDERVALTDHLQSAQDLLVESDGKVVKSQVLEQLQLAIASGLQAARTDPAGMGSAKDASVAKWRDTERQVIAAAAVLQAAVDAVELERATWDLQQANSAWQAAHTELSAALDDASSVVAASAGHVADDAVRQALATAITPAMEARDVEVDAGDVEQLTQAVDGATAAAATLSGPIQAVREAQNAWLAEQDRLAAANAAAAAAAAPAAKGASQPAPFAPAPSAAKPPASSAPTVAAPSTSSSIDPGQVASSGRTPGQVTVSAITTGINGPVVVRVGDWTITIGTGSGSFTGTFTGLPPGSYPWSVTADGHTAQGNGTAVVYP